MGEHHEVKVRVVEAIVAPEGAKATWRSLSPVRKFWAVYREPGEEAP